MSPAVNFEQEAEVQAKPPWESRLTVIPPVWYSTPPPNRQWLLRDSRREGEGVFPMGKVGMLIAEGGAGKTMALCQLAIATATGSKWLGTFEVPKPGKVLVVLGEEDEEEVHRRIHRAARVDGGVVPPEGAIVTLPLTGIACPMIDEGEDAPFLVWLRNYVKETGPYALIGIDPVSRFAGADAERDNAAGTRFCQALESLVPVSGGASVIAAHHVNKQSRGSGATVDASSSRGASSLTDGVRWVSSIGVEYIEESVINTVLKFAVVKTNYSKKPPPLDMRYDDGGVLVPLDDKAREVADAAREEADPRARREKKRGEAKVSRDTEIDAAVIACITKIPGIGATDLRVNVKATTGCGSDAADTAIARATQAGRIRRTEGKTKEHHLVETAAVEEPSHTATTNGAMSGMSIDPMDML